MIGIADSEIMRYKFRGLQEEHTMKMCGLLFVCVIFFIG